MGVAVLDEGEIQPVTGHQGHRGVFPLERLGDEGGKGQQPIVLAGAQILRPLAKGGAARPSGPREQQPGAQDAGSRRAEDALSLQRRTTLLFKPLASLSCTARKKGSAWPLTLNCSP